MGKLQLLMRMATRIWLVIILILLVKVIQYQVVNESGPAHAKEFEVEVFVNGKTLGHGHGRSKKLAEQEAARNAVETRNDGSCI